MVFAAARLVSSCKLRERDDVVLAHRLTERLVKRRSKSEILPLSSADGSHIKASPRHRCLWYHVRPRAARQRRRQFQNRHRGAGRSQSITDRRHPPSCCFRPL